MIDRDLHDGVRFFGFFSRKTSDGNNSESTKYLILCVPMVHIKVCFHTKFQNNVDKRFPPAQRVMLFFFCTGWERNFLPKES